MDSNVADKIRRRDSAGPSASAKYVRERTDRRPTEETAPNRSWTSTASATVPYSPGDSSRVMIGSVISEADNWTTVATV